MPIILVVEDNKLLQDIMLHQLQRFKFQVIQARTGLEAVRKAKSDQPDLIVMDLRLPLLSGGEAIRQIKADPSTAHIPIIVMTAQPDEIVESVAREDFLLKPFDFDELLGRIHSHLGLSA